MHGFLQFSIERRKKPPYISLEADENFSSLFHTSLLDLGRALLGLFFARREIKPWRMLLGLNLWALCSSLALGKMGKK